MLLRDSFGNSLSPFLSLGIARQMIIDLRVFTGSLRTFIRQEKPDIVVVMYTAESAGDELGVDPQAVLYDFE